MFVVTLLFRPKYKVIDEHRLINSIVFKHFVGPTGPNQYHYYHYNTITISIRKLRIVVKLK